MKKALLIARWEFLSTVTRRAYIFAVVAMPLFFAVPALLQIVSARASAPRGGARPIAIVDSAGVVDVGVAAGAAASRSRLQAATTGTPAVPPSTIVAYDTLDRALDALRADEVSAVYELSADYVTSGRVTGYGPEAGLFAQAFGTQRQAQVADAIRASLLEAHLEDDALVRAYAPMAAFERRIVTRDGQVTEATDGLGLGPFFGSFAILMLFTLSIFFSAGFLQQATIEDRQNRMIEILLSSTSPDQLLLGKIIGLGGAGLLQVGFYVLLIIVPGSTLLAVFSVPFGALALSLVYFVIGYLLFACLMAGTGMIGRSPQEGAQLSMLWTFTAVTPLFFLQAIGSAPHGAIARTLSFFPLTSPVTMIMRLTTSAVPVVDIIGSIVVGAAAIYVTFRGAAKIFRAASLMHGKQATLPEVVRWLGAA